MRDGQRKDVQITPESARTARLTIDGDRMLDGSGDDLGNLGDHLPPFNFNFDFDTGRGAGRRLGVTVDGADESARRTTFGTKDGLLVTSVVDGSAAARAGLKAGDVITSINGDRVRSRDDLVRGLRDARRGRGSDGGDRARQEGNHREGEDRNAAPNATRQSGLRTTATAELPEVTRRSTLTGISPISYSRCMSSTAHGS